MTDQEHATKIREKAREFQEAINEAINFGMTVSIEVREKMGGWFNGQEVNWPDIITRISRPL